MSLQNSYLLKYTKKTPLKKKQECPICKKQFSLPAVLAKHLKTQHEVQMQSPKIQKNSSDVDKIKKQKEKTKPSGKDQNESMKKDIDHHGDGDQKKIKKSDNVQESIESKDEEMQEKPKEETPRRRGRPRKTDVSTQKSGGKASGKGKAEKKETLKSNDQLNTRQKLFSGKDTATQSQHVKQKSPGLSTSTPKKAKDKTTPAGRKRTLQCDDTESDSQTDGSLRPKRSRQKKRAWSPSNDNSIKIDITIKQEPVDLDYGKITQIKREAVIKPEFSCDICSRSFASFSGLSRHMKVHNDSDVEDNDDDDNDDGPSNKSQEKSVADEANLITETVESEEVTLERVEKEIAEPLEDDQPESAKKDVASVKVQTSKEVETSFEDDDNVDKDYKPPIKRRRSGKAGRTYPCKSCEKVFTKPSHLIRHEIKHTGERPFPCDVCGKGFVSKSNMEKHRVLHSGVKSKICDECGKAFALSSYLVRHKMLHEKERNEKLGIKPEPEHHLCSECGKVFSKSLYLQKHMERHIKGKCYECRICGKKFSQRMNRINHEFLHSKTKNFDCQICHKKFALKCYLKIHMQRHMKSPEGKVEKKPRVNLGMKPYKCGDCGKSYSSSKYLAAHEKLHENPKKFVCETCGRNFHQKINLQRHTLTHTDPATSKNYECKECGKKYSRDIYLDRHVKENHTVEGLAKPRHHCKYCEKTFTKPCLLRIHERTHTKEKPFVCSTCGKGFAQEGYMKIHEEIHSDVKKHECQFCGKSFALLYYLTRHLARHEQVKSIPCEQCSKMFATKKALLDHQRIHTGDLPFKCDLCDRSFPRANSLQRHKKLNACQNKTITQTFQYFPRENNTGQPISFTEETLDQYLERKEYSCLYICSICRQVFTSQAKLDAHAVEHGEVAMETIVHEEPISAESIPVTKEEETIIAEVVNVEEGLLNQVAGEEITTEETIVDAEWLNKLFSNAHVESGTDGKIIIVVNRE